MGLIPAIDQIIVAAGLIGALAAFSRRPGAIGAGMLLAGFAAGVTMSIVLG